MKKILVLGAGNIGRLICLLLANSQKYFVFLADFKIEETQLHFLKNIQNSKLAELDACDKKQLKNFLVKNQIETVVVCLPFFCNLTVAEICHETHTHYFNLSEDIQSTKAIYKLAENASCLFMPQCGLAPGFVSIAGNSLTKGFESVKSLHIRVGALPQFSHHALKYALTWSTDGLIQEYNHPSFALINGKKTLCHPLTDLETIVLDGTPYEAFHTSGGVGSLVDHFEGKIETLNYKTLRYPGHCDKMRFLMRDLDLGKDPKKLKAILEASVPRTQQDVVIIYLCAEGLKNNQLYRESYFKKITPYKISNHLFSAIQIATASSACATVDLVLTRQKPLGFIFQESIALNEFLKNPFSACYQD